MMTKTKQFIVIVFCSGLLIAGVFYSESLAVYNLEPKLKELNAETLAKKDALEDAATMQGETISRPKPEFQDKDFKDPFQDPMRKTREAAKQSVKPSTSLVEDNAVSKSAGSTSKRSLPVALAVQGLIWGGNFPQAIINNTVVRVGDEINKVKVSAIDKDGVTVLYENFTYKLPPPGTKVEGEKMQK